ncbi:Fur family transcriptional regulator, peroxide stress response regulator [Granulicatella balaenopterae]|uniref:Fur family transcriptional regulator, peroxide stress response regulator n=2 Tax=Granulicatella balaenopterae TaxID=137733 RepID=A0A1H9L4C3_9LACT|nr:Fur family transcriptional regulator, peroxide stress response regulator [Granulicatella balaenopterae]
MVENIIIQLRQDGVRITPQREAILNFLAESDKHPTADDIYQALSEEYKQMSVATVYNNLRLFTSYGFVKEMTYGDNASRFDFSSTEHYHVICEKCGCIEDLFYPILSDVEEIAEELTGFKVTHHRMEVYGICPRCATEKMNSRGRV